MKIIFLILFIVTFSSQAFSKIKDTSSFYVLKGHMIPPSVTSNATPYKPKYKNIYLAVRLPMQNADQLKPLINRLYTPGDPLYKKFFRPEEFSAKFGAKQTDINRVETYFKNLNCAIKNLHKNHLLLNVECPIDAIETAFKIKISHWLSKENEIIRTIDTNPSIPKGIPIEAIHGLTTSPRHPQFVRKDPNEKIPSAGSGPNGGMSPSDIKTAYNLNASSLNGAGQVLGLFELDGFNSSDVATYKSYFNINPGVPLQTVLVDGFNGSAGAGAVEVVLDIDLMMAIAPGAKQIIVYEGPNTDAGVLDVYQRMADDNLASQLSSSWGLAENLNSPSFLISENNIFQQMAVQGQSFYAASGDGGAYDDRRTLSVDDPASQPYVTGAGGTTLITNNDHSYLTETAWWSPQRRIGGGGGISNIWAIPSWQNGAITTASGGSTTNRNVPDVALNSDPQTGYAIYIQGQWQVYGGTSCAAPLWAAFTALVNQGREINQIGPLGFASSTLYQIGMSSNYLSNFHDINDGSTNGYYPAVSNYDLATGWGTPIGMPLLQTLGAGVAQVKDFSLTTAPSQQTVQPGQTANYSVTVNPLGGFNGNVTFSISGLPTGATADFSPNPTLSTSTLSINTSSTTPAGSYSLTITGMSGSLVHTTTVTLIVGKPDFALTISPTSQIIRRGRATNYTINVTKLSGFSGNVSLSITGLPSRASAFFSPNPTSSSSRLTINTSSIGPIGIFRLRITGTSGSISHATSAILFVTR